MLVKKSYGPDTIVSFKLVNGDEIVARVQEEREQEFVLNKPCTVMPSSKGLGLIQSLFTSDIDKTIVLDKRHVMMHSQTVKDVESHYIQTTTGIVTASNGGLVK